MEDTIEAKIRVALARANISQAELARRVGQTPSNLNQKIKRGTLTYEEMKQIAADIGCRWVAEFVFNE